MLQVPKIPNKSSSSQVNLSWLMGKHVLLYNVIQFIIEKTKQKQVSNVNREM